MPSTLVTAAPRRVGVVLVLVLLVSSLLAGGTGVTSAPAEARAASPKASESIRIDMGKQRFGKIDGWGIDLKQKCTWNNPKCRTRAQIFARDRKDIVERTFGDGRFSWIRVSFRADRRGLNDDPERRNTAEPTINWAYYRPTIKAIQNIVAEDPSVRVWASRDTVTDCNPAPGEHRGVRDPDTTALGPGADGYYRGGAGPVDPKNPVSCPDYHPWLKGGSHGGKLIPWRYGKLAARFVDFMNRRLQGTTRVSVLGLDNEPHNNEGELTPPRFLAAAKALQANLETPMPRLMMNCASRPDPGWLRRAKPKVARKIDFATAHSHPKRRLKERRVARPFAQLARKKGMTLYNTELHWETTKWPFNGVAQSLRSVFDQLDVGFRGFSIWAHAPESGNNTGPRKTKARVTNALFRSTQKARLVRTTDWDGASTDDNHVTTRAFRRGDVVYLWIVNDRANGYSGRALDVRDPRGRTQTPRAVSYKRWFVSKKGKIAQVAGRATRSRGTVRVGVPGHSVTLARIQM